MMDHPQFLRATLVLPVCDIAESTGWYRHALGFETVYLHGGDNDDEAVNYAILQREGAMVHLILDEPPREHPWTTAGTGYLYLTVRDAGAVYSDVTARGVEVLHSVQRQDWGPPGFRMRDPSGNLILVAEDP